MFSSNFKLIISVMFAFKSLRCINVQLIEAVEQYVPPKRTLYKIITFGQLEIELTRQSNKDRFISKYIGRYQKSILIVHYYLLQRCTYICL